MIKILICALSVASAFKVQEPKPALQKTLALRGGLSAETTALIGAIYNGGFGVTLLASPEMFYGKDGLMPYFKTAIGPVAQTFIGRAFGACLTALASANFIEGIPKEAVCKLYAYGALLVLIPMLLTLQDTENFVAMMWRLQVPVHSGLIYILSKGAGLI